MLRQLSLRTRLVLGVLLLAAAALITADVFTSRSLRSFLIQLTDSSLQSAHQEVEAALLGSRGVPSSGRPPASNRPSAAPSAPPSAAALGSLVRSLPGLFIETRRKSGKILFKGQV